MFNGKDLKTYFQTKVYYDEYEQILYIKLEITMCEFFDIHE